ncbi:MAG TPA: hypothetical protein VIP29_08265 [Nitrososphaeraceae archaeon]
MEKVLEELVRSLAAPSATTWFKVTGNKKPNPDEYRKKVVEFMNLFESSLSLGYRNNINSKDILDFIKKGVRDHVDVVLSGKNKDVEKRYKYYVDYG